MFKVGDKVRLVEPYGKMSIGNLGTVRSVRPSNMTMIDGRTVTHMVYVNFGGEYDDYGVFDFRIELAQPKTPVTPQYQISNTIGCIVATTDRIFPRRSYDTILKSLMEELGELSTEIAIVQGTKQREPSPDGVKGEAVDVFIVAVDMLRAAWGDKLFSPEFTDKVASKLAKWEGK